jgi:hypothetical protein
LNHNDKIGDQTRRLLFAVDGDRPVCSRLFLVASFPIFVDDA